MKVESPRTSRSQRERRAATPRFEAVHRALLDARAVLDAPGLGQAVQKVGLDAQRLLSAAQSGAHNASIDADVALGKRLGVNGVPTYFVNGVRKDGLMTLPELEQAVKRSLRSASA